MVAEPSLLGNEKKYVADCMDSGWISSHGKYLQKFEEAFAEFCGVKHAIATNNGTTALHLALVALGLAPGDEVIIPTVTYIATANAVSYCGAKPILVDSIFPSLNIDPQKIERAITSRTRGIIPVHLYGQPADMDAINKIAKKYGLWVLEDAAEAHGAEIMGKKVGSIGDCATFSFFGNKIITTGEGGMVTTNDDDLAKKLRLYRGQGVDPEKRYWFPVIGYNYRMTNIQAAIGLAQLENITEALNARAKLAMEYSSFLTELDDLVYIPQPDSWGKHVFWMYTILLKRGGDEYRNKLMGLLSQAGIETRPCFYPMHILPPYKQVGAFPIADTWSSRGINLPTHQKLTKEDARYVVDVLKKSL